MEPRNPLCPDCDQGMTRRDFGKTLGSVAVVAGTTHLLATPLQAAKSPMVNSAAINSAGISAVETAVAEFYGTLTEGQKKIICFPFEDEKRLRISANWRITEPRIEDDFYTDEQRRLIDQIYRSVTSPDGYERFQRQLEEDSGGFARYHVGVFGKPGTGKFEWEMTGRHCTIRAAGETAGGLAFGGPTIYGHGETNPDKNLFHYQTQKANEVFSALDAAQRKEALLPGAPIEIQVPLQGQAGKFPGIRVGELSSDQKELVKSAIQVILAPYRKERADEALAVVKKNGGLDELHLSFYRKGDLNEDEIWDIWRVEGPAFVWHFRGAPHVHAYVNIGQPRST